MASASRRWAVQFPSKNACSAGSMPAQEYQTESREVDECSAERARWEKPDHRAAGRVNQVLAGGRARAVEQIDEATWLLHEPVGTQTARVVDPEANGDKRLDLAASTQVKKEQERERIAAAAEKDS